MSIRADLKQYIESAILPEYAKNEVGHDANHAQYVIDRSLRFAREAGADLEMAYVIAAYHDIGHHIDYKNHERVSADMLLADQNLKHFFSDEQIQIMADAVYDHRSTDDAEPRTIYGRIVRTADLKTSVDAALRATYSYRAEHNPEYTLAENMEESRQHLISKYGKNGYANEKDYFNDVEFAQFLKDIAELTADKAKFRRRFLEANHLPQA